MGFTMKFRFLEKYPKNCVQFTLNFFDIVYNKVI